MDPFDLKAALLAKHVPERTPGVIFLPDARLYHPVGKIDLAANADSSLPTIPSTMRWRNPGAQPRHGWSAFT
jgi:hypothetical protein